VAAAVELDQGEPSRSSGVSSSI